jgi:hypothetical protein
MYNLKSILLTAGVFVALAAGGALAQEKPASSPSW